MSLPPRNLVSFGPYLLDVERHVLTKGEEPVALPPKDLDTLVVLVQNAGQLVEKQALMEAVWPGTFVEEANIPRHIFNIRQALEADDGSPEYIQTVPKRGYRFAVPVTPVVAPPEPGKVESEMTIGQTTGIQVATDGPTMAAPKLPKDSLSSRSHLALWAKVAIGLGGAVLAAAVFLFVIPRRHAATAYNPSARREMIAVLPVTNLTGDASEEYLSDGLTEELIAQLGTTSPEGLGVIARTSSMTYKNTGKDVSQIARELNVDYVLETSLRGTPQHFRVTAQLIRASDQAHVWAKEYDREDTDLLGLEDEIGWSVARQIRSQLVASNAVTPSTHTMDPAAHELYLRGRFAWNTRTRDGLEKSLDLFRQATLKDPKDARAYAGLADAHNMLLFYGYEHGIDAVKSARMAAESAIEMDPSLAEGHAALAYTNFWWLNDWESAEREFRRAIELDANYVSAHHWYALYLAAMGRNVEAIDQVRIAETLDPRSLIVKSAAGFVYYFARQPEQVIRECKDALAIEPNFMVAHAVLGLAEEEQGNYDEAISEFQQALADSKIRSATYLAYLGHAYGRAGRRPEAEAIVKELEGLEKAGYPASVDLAMVYSGMGEKEKALKEIEESLASHDASIVWLGVSPQLDGLRGEARYAAVLGKLKLHAAA